MIPNSRLVAPATLAHGATDALLDELTRGRAWRRLGALGGIPHVLVTGQQDIERDSLFGGSLAPTTRHALEIAAAGAVVERDADDHEGAALSAEAGTWMVREGLLNPDRSVEILAPGLRRPAS